MAYAYYQTQVPNWGTPQVPLFSTSLFSHNHHYAESTSSSNLGHCPCPPSILNLHVSEDTYLLPLSSFVNSNTRRSLGKGYDFYNAYAGNPDP